MSALFLLRMDGDDRDRVLLHGRIAASSNDPVARAVQSM
jgi:hypothetical protein